MLCLATGTELTGFSTRTWLLIGAVTVSAQLFGHSLLNHLLAVMSPIVISLLLLLEVPVAALLAGVFLGQSPAWGVYVGPGDDPHRARGGDVSTPTSGAGAGGLSG